MKITGIAKQSEYYDFIDYEDKLDFDACYDLVKNHVIENNIRISGSNHQNYYLPIIDDKYIFLLSMRFWGDLIA